MEVFYLLILSIFGQFCDKIGMLRVHALGLSYHDKALLLTMPPGRGNSTMALSMLQEENVMLISDDAPLFDTFGYILPLPLHIGFLDKNSIEFVPDEYIYSIDRMEFGPKYFVDYDYWKDRLEKRPLKDVVLFIAHRVLNGSPSIEKASKRKAFASLLRDAVIGIGLYQGLEFILNSSVWEILSKIPTIFKRLILALKLIRISKTYRFTLSRNIEENTRLFKEFIQKLP